MNKRDLKKFRENYTDWQYGCFSEGLRLAVHFDEKDEVKRLGARWNPDPSGKGGHWWMPKSKCTTGGLQWLNKNKMIVGSYGTIERELADNVTIDMDNEKFVLSDGASEYAVMRFPAIGLILFYTADDGRVWYDEAEGRETWNSLVAQGFFRLSEVSS